MLTTIRKTADAGAAIKAGPATFPFLQRKCACGGTLGRSGECDACRAKRLRRAQPKLTVSQPNDPLEQEADRAADQVVAISSLGQQRTEVTTRQSQPVSEKGPTNLATSHVVPNEEMTVPPLVHEVLSWSGEPLDSDARGVMEQRFGYDFAHVRVHRDAKSAESARSVNALAFTVGDHVVFGSNQFAPTTNSGRHLLAHELAHTLQQNTGQLSRQPNDPKKKVKPPPGTLRPHVPVAPPPPRTSDVPPGVTPCLKGAVCEPPIKGSAWDFGKKSEKESKPRPKSPIPAKEVKKAAETAAPGVLHEIFEVTVNPGLASDVGAQVDICKEFNVKASNASARCMEVPKDLEEEAALFNQGRDCLDKAKSASEPLCNPFLDRDLWQKNFVETMTHEPAHIKFRRNTPIGISGRTSNEITLHELSEMYAQLSEFPVHYRGVAKFIAHEKDPKARQATLQTSITAWVKQHADSEGEGFRGMLTKIRCINDCEKVGELVNSLVESLTSNWDGEITSALLDALNRHPQLDWPQPLNLRPEPERPKFAPLYRPRGTFVPEIEQSAEDLP